LVLKSTPIKSFNSAFYTQKFEFLRVLRGFA
jgi:hypothetical protein